MRHCPATKQIFAEPVEAGRIPGLTALDRGGAIRFGTPRPGTSLQDGLHPGILEVPHVEAVPVRGDERGLGDGRGRLRALGHLGERRTRMRVVDHAQVVGLLRLLVDHPLGVPDGHAVLVVFPQAGLVLGPEVEGRLDGVGRAGRGLDVDARDVRRLRVRADQAAGRGGEDENDGEQGVGELHGELLGGVRDWSRAADVLEESRDTYIGRRLSVYGIDKKPPANNSKNLTADLTIIWFSCQGFLLSICFIDQSTLYAIQSNYKFLNFDAVYATLFTEYDERKK